MTFQLAGCELFVVVCQGKDRILSGGDRGLRGSFVVHKRAFHAIFTFPITVTLARMPPRSSSAYLALLSPLPLPLFFRNAEMLEYLWTVVSSLHDTSQFQRRGRLWHIFLTLCWRPRGGTAEAEGYASQRSAVKHHDKHLEIYYFMIRSKKRRQSDINQISR